MALCGYSDNLLATLVSRGSGCITGLVRRNRSIALTRQANIAPKTIKRLFDVSVRAIQTGDAETMREAQRLQDIVSAADGAVSAHGLTGCASTLQRR